MVSEAFLYFFVKTVGHYASYVKYSKAGGRGVFEKRSFYKAIESKTTRHFVKKFIQTQMFDLFIQEVEQQQPGPQQGDTHIQIPQILYFVSYLFLGCSFLNVYIEEESVIIMYQTSNQS